MNSFDVIDYYNSGSSIKKIAKYFHKRSSNISEILKNNKIDVENNRGDRIGNTQRGSVSSTIYKSKGIVSQLKREEWAYIAGVFDGEGNISFSNKNLNVRITIAQKEVKLLYWLKDILGCGIVNLAKNNCNNSYRINTTKEVYDFLLNVISFLIVKKDQAQNTIDYLKERYFYVS